MLSFLAVDVCIGVEIASFSLHWDAAKAFRLIEREETGNLRMRRATDGLYTREWKEDVEIGSVLCRVLDLLLGKSSSLRT